MGRKPPALQRRIAAWLAANRVAAGVTQEALAARLGMATRNLQRIESGTQNLTLQTVERVAGALGVDTTALVPGVTDRAHAGPLGLHVVPGPEGGRTPLAVPVLSLRAAAGFARSGRVVDAIGWTLLPSDDPGRSFVAQVAGRSMEPLIPDRSWSVFRATPDVDVGTIALFELRQRGDPDGGGSYLVKRLAERGRDRLVLASLNPAFPRVELDERKAATLRVVARWVAVVARR